MLPLVIPEMAYWMICEKSVIEPQPYRRPRTLQSSFRGVINVDLGKISSPPHYSTFSYKIYNSTKVVF